MPKLFGKEGEGTRLAGGRESPAGTLTGVWLGGCQLPDCKASGKGGPSGLTMGTSGPGSIGRTTWSIKYQS